MFLFLLMWTNSLAAVDTDDASKYIYGFRKDNQFSLLFAVARRNWQLHAGDEFQEHSVAAHFVYRFQLQLVKSFGYYLGTCFGFRYSFPASRRNFYTLLVPGAVAGIVGYVNASWQALLGAEILLERVPHLPSQEGLLPSFSLASYALVLTLEHYLTLNTALAAALAIDMLPHENEHVAGLQELNGRIALGINYHLL